MPLSQSPIIKALIGKFGPILSYVPNGIDDTDGVRALLASGKALGGPADMIVRGPVSRHWIKPGMEYDLTGLSADCRFEIEGLALKCWDPADPDGTIGGWFKGTGTWLAPLAPNLDIRWGTLDYFPKVTCDCNVTFVNPDPDTGFFRVKPKPGFEPAWTTMRVFHGISKDIWFASQSEERGSSSGVSYPIVPDPANPGEWIVTPSKDVLTITGIDKFNPLTLIGTGMDSERLFLASGFTGPDAGNINGHTYTFDLEQGSATKGVLLEDGVEVNATGWSITGYGVLTSPRIPTWVTVGLEMILVCRKRGNPEFDPRYHKGWTLTGNVKAATAVFFAGAYGEDLTINSLIFKGEGRMSCTAGGLVLIEHRGFLKINNLDASGMGDDTSNQTPRYWNKFLSTTAPPTSTTITLDATRVWMPRLTDTILFISPTGVRTKVTPTIIDATVQSATVITFAPGDIPSGFDPATWTVRNADVVARVRAKSLSDEGAARSFFYQTGDASADITNVRNTRGPVVRCQDPKSGAHSQSGGFVGGLNLGAYNTYRTSMVYGSTLSCANFVYRIQNSTQNSGLPPVTHGRISSNGYGFAFSIAEGIDVYYPDVYLQNTESQRALTPALVANPTRPGNFDFVSIAQTTTVGRLNPEALLWVKISTSLGGNVVIANRGALGQLLTTTDADATITTLAYNKHKITSALSVNRNFTLSKAGAQPGDVFTYDHSGTGNSAVYKNEDGSTIVTVGPGNKGSLVFTSGGTWATFSTSGGGGTYTANNGITLSGSVFGLSPVADQRLLGNVSGGSAYPVELTPAQVRTLAAVNNVDNTSDANKPVSTAQQTALNLKANLSGGNTLGGTQTIARADVAILDLTSTDLTIASDAVTVTGSRHTIDTEAAAASDDLVTINGATAVGQLLIITNKVSGRVVTVRQTGNISLFGNDVVLRTTSQALLLWWTGSVWARLAYPQTSGVTEYTTDANTTFTGTSNPEIMLTGPWTSAHTITLGTNNFENLAIRTITNETNQTATIKNSAATTIDTLAANTAGRYRYRTASDWAKMPGI